MNATSMISLSHKPSILTPVPHFAFTCWIEGLDIDSQLKYHSILNWPHISCGIFISALLPALSSLIYFLVIFIWKFNHALLHTMFRNALPNTAPSFIGALPCWSSVSCSKEMKDCTDLITTSCGWVPPFHIALDIARLTHLH